MSPKVGSRRFASLTRTMGGVVAAAAAVAAVACVTDLPTDTRTVWEATLVGQPAYPLANGGAAAVSRGSSTEASISIGGLDEGTYRWGVFRGDCEGPGDLLGGNALYPELDGSTGAATAEAFVSLPMDSGEDYAARVTTPEAAVVACGNFEPWQP